MKWKGEQMSVVVMSREMTALVSRFIDSFFIDEEEARLCSINQVDPRNLTPEQKEDPLILMAYACVYYGCMRYTEALYNVRQAKRVFVREDNPFHYDALCVLEVMLLKVLSRIPQALECAHEHLKESEGPSRRMLNILSIQMYQTQGLYEEACLLIDGLLAKESDEFYKHRLILMRAVCDRDQSGDYQVFCSAISSAYWYALNETHHDEGARVLLALYGSELAFAYAWQGRMDLVASVLKDMKVQGDGQSSISHIIATTLNQCANQKFDEALLGLSDESVRSPGTSLEDVFLTNVTKLVIMHFAGHKREALPLAVRLSEFAKSHPASIMSGSAHLLLVSVLLWMYDFAQAETLLTQFVMEHTLTCMRPYEHAMYACLNALIALREQDHVRGHEFIQDARGYICDPNSSLMIAALCAIHPTLLGVLSNTLDIDSLPSNLTELLDHTRYHETVSVSCEMLSKEEGQLFQKRFTRVDAGMTAVSDDRSKPVVLQLFGGLSISMHGKQIDVSMWSRSKSHQLFLRTILEQGGDLPRDSTLALFWPNLSKTAASNNYYVTLGKMIRFLADKRAPDDDIEIITRATCGKVRLNLLVCECDVGHFDSAVISARKRVLERDYMSALQHYYRMVELYRGDLLVGDYEYRWLDVHRKRFRKQFLDSMVSASRICLELGQPHEAHFFIDAALRHDPGREAFYEMSLKAYKAMGRREDALNAYYECVEYLQDKLGLDPSPEFNALFNEIVTA